MKVAPKSSLRPFLHRALQLFPEVEVNSERYSTEPQSGKVNIFH